PPPDLIVKNDGLQENFQPAGLQRDPFKRRQLPAPNSTLSTKSTVGPGAEIPGWQLLGIIHGPAGYQAVVQTSPHERTILHPGAELAQSGWTAKTINPNGVVMERASTSLLKSSSPPQHFILSFPSRQKIQK